MKGLLTLSLIGCLLSLACGWSISEGQKVVLTAGQQAEIVCEVSGADYNAFGTPLNIYKTQGNYDPEEVKKVAEGSSAENIVQVSNLGSVQPPFADRYTATVTPGNPFKVTLTIRNLQAADNGYYSCVVKDDDNVQMKTHQVWVEQSATKLTLWGFGDASMSKEFNPDDINPPNPDGPVVYSENTPGFLSCVAEGGYPMPTMEIYSGDKRVGPANFASKTVIKNGTMSGVKGLRTFTPVYIYHTLALEVTGEMSGQNLRCEAKQSDSGTPMTQTMQIDVNYSPVMLEEKCAATQYGQEGSTITMECSFRAKPAARSIVWKNVATGYEYKLDTEVTTIVEAEHEFKTTVAIENANSDAFTVYEVIVNNNVEPEGKRQVTLERGNSQSGGVTDGVAMLTASFLVNLFAATVICFL